ncbi:RNA-directed DNA polymerase (Reverse transcriptase), Ribonuclease H [Gossypium australe]|uniref:RNA-directed DNA polymerase (Reverse transcriptase), Ribonuclease H n=1 Tax=Gossypium australe TaxID=47621 RepID=A0A5B6VN01_9ROSI|nr:RNA-directed DNA polymerase (Reverse transcriptase), Ribonuclease H [Gossypium australe]
MGNGIGVVLVYLDGDHYPFTSQLDFDYTNNMAEYEACIIGICATIECKIKVLEPKASNGHRFIFVVIDYFTKWVEVTSYANVTKSAVSKFFKKETICRYGMPKRIISDNTLNLNNSTITEVCSQFKIKHHNLSLYRPKRNGVVEAANKNVKKIEEKMTEKLKLDNAEWIQSRYDQLNLIEEKRLKVVHHVQMYQKWMMRAYDKKVRPREFHEGDLVLKNILPIQKELIGKWIGALILTKIDGKNLPNPVNSDSVKKYFT